MQSEKKNYSKSHLPPRCCVEVDFPLNAPPRLRGPFILPGFGSRITNQGYY